MLGVILLGLFVGSHALARIKNVPAPAFPGTCTACVCDIGIGKVDLNQLTREGSDYPGTDSAYQYYLNFCSPAASHPNCKAANGVFCMYLNGVFSSDLISALATTNSPGPVATPFMEV